MSLNLFWLGFQTSLSQYPGVWSSSPKDARVSNEFHLANPTFSLDPLLIAPPEAFLFMARATHGSGNQFINFECNNKSFTHLLNSMVDFLWLIRRAMLLSNNNRLNMYDQIYLIRQIFTLLTFREPCIKDYHRKYTPILKVWFLFWISRNQRFLNCHSYRS